MKYSAMSRYKSSIDKWENILQNCLEGKPCAKDQRDRRTYWYGHIWTSCGFCFEFRSPDGKHFCKECPLHPKYCSLTIKEENDKILMTKIYKQFINNDKSLPETIKQFIAILKSCKPIFEKRKKQTKGETNDKNY